MTTEASKAPAAPPKEEELTLELVDDAQIMAELQGMHFEEDKFVFPIHGGFALTYKAIKLACRMFEERGEALEVVGDVFTKYDEKDPEYIIVHVKVQRVKVTPKGVRIPLGSEVGVKRKWIYEKLRDGTSRPDPSFYEKACAQAQRNAKQALLPQDFLLEFKQLVISKGGAKGVPARPAAPSKPQGAAAKPAGAAATAQGSSKPANAPAGAPPAQGTPPAKGAPPTGSSAAPANPPSGEAGQAPKDPAKRKLSMQQQFWVVFKNAIPQAKTEKQQRVTLMRLTGKDHVRDLDEAVIQKLGPALRRVSEGESVIRETENAAGVKTLVIYHTPSSLFHWPPDFKPKAQAQAAPPAAAEPAGDPEAPPPADEEKLF